MSPQKLKQSYIRIEEGKAIERSVLLQEKRPRMRILLIDAEKDIPVKGTIPF